MILSGSPKRTIPRRYAVAFYISVFAALILVPALLLGARSAWQAADFGRQQIKQHAAQDAREIVAAVEREITIAQSMLVALASSPALQDGDLERFFLQVQDVAAKLNVQIVVSDPVLDRQIMNTAVPADQMSGLPERRPQPMREAQRRASQSGKPAVTGLFQGPLIKRDLVAVVVPVFRNGAIAYFLSVGIPAEQLRDIVRGIQLSTQGLATIIDRNNVIVARSQKHESFVGTTTRNDVNTQAADASGEVEGKNVEGVPSYWTYRRSGATGWLVGVGVSLAVVDAESRRILVNYALAGVFLFAVAILLSCTLGVRLSRSMGALGIDRKPTREEFETLFDSAPYGVAVVSDGNIALVNTRMHEKFGYKRAELIGRPVEVLVPERFRVDSNWREAFAPGHRTAAKETGLGLSGQRKDGSEFPIEVDFNPIAIRSGHLVIVTVVDMTARKRAADSLLTALFERDNLRRRLTQAQEDERMRLAHELHDQTGQSLTAVMLELKGLEPTVSDLGRDQFRILRKQLEQMGKALHHVAWELRPASIDDLGLASALADYVTEWSRQYGIDADFHCGDFRVDEIPSEIGTALYRVAQEALSNVAKHATDASTVSVVLDRTAATLQLTIEDNGVGFEPAQVESAARSRRLGLAGMRERLSLIGGQLEIESSAGAGTTIFARVTLEQQRLSA